jgi:hypothetical protein
MGDVAELALPAGTVERPEFVRIAPKSVKIRSNSPQEREESKKRTE